MKTYILALLLGLLFLGSCGMSGNSNDVVGSWKEYRADSNDDYGLSTWKFNNDGSGLFIVGGYTNTQKTSFMWEKINSTTIKIKIGNETSTLELSNGMLIEKSGFGTTVFRKQ